MRAQLASGFCSINSLSERLVVIIATYEKHVAIFTVFDLREPQVFTAGRAKPMLKAFRFGDLFQCRFAYAQLLFGFVVELFCRLRHTSR